VLAPIALGMTLNKYAPKFVKAILPFAPVVGVVSTCLLVASAVAQVAEPILNAGLTLQVNKKQPDFPKYHTVFLFSSVFTLLVACLFCCCCSFRAFFCI
jgi:predicted Na+-dependent transporter